MTFAYLNGQFVPESEAKISIFDHGFLYGDSIYDTLRGYKNKVWNLDAHLNRFYEGAEFLKLTIPHTKEELKGILTELLTRNSHEQSRIRMLISRGPNGYKFSTCENPTLMITAIPLTTFPPQIADLMTMKFERPVPHIKSTSLVITNLARQMSEMTGAIDILFINRDNVITEGSISNVFMVKNGVLITPTENNLAGTIQQMILQMAEAQNMPIKTKNITLEELLNADEVFITSVLKLVLPIGKVNETIINNYEAGPITFKLKKLADDAFEKFKNEA